MADANGTFLLHEETPLMMCSRTGNIATVKTLLDKGAKVNAKETLRETTALMWAVAQNHVEVVSTLVENGADVNAREQAMGQTPLMFAAAYNRLDAIQALIKANPLLKGRDPKELKPRILTLTQSTYDGVLYNTERIEVSRGPGGIAYGDTDATGVINLTTKRGRFRNEVEAGLRFDNHAWSVCMTSDEWKAKLESFSKGEHRAT